MPWIEHADETDEKVTELNNEIKHLKSWLYTFMIASAALVVAVCALAVGR